MEDREITDVLLTAKSPPDYFEGVVSREKNWVAALSFRFETARFNTFIPLPDQDLEEIPEELKELARNMNRTPSIYGEEAWIEEVAEQLPADDFEEAFAMTYLVPDELPDLENLPDLEIRKVEDNEEMREKFIEVFEDAFSTNGEVPQEMLEGLRSMMEKEWPGKIQEFYLGYRDGEAVTSGTITIKNGKAYLYNVGTRQEFQGEGLGTANTVKLVREAEKHDIEDVYIGTEPGTTVEEFYRKMGCRKAFTAKALKSQDILD